MTVSYAGEVPNGSSFGCFWKILWKWRGSVYKLVWRELVAYLCLYYTINLVYRFVLNDHQQKIFAKIRVYFGQQSESIPMSFVLGFYVNLVVKRWWEQYRLLPWPDTLALFISAAIPNSNGGVNNETGRLMRRNIMRYMVLAYVITLQRISLRVKRRFPTTQHLVDAGLMHESEMKIFEAMNQKSPMSKYWMPLVWATNIINRARKDGLISSDHIVQTILMELSDIRRRLGGLIGYDTVCVPLVYTQVVTLVLYTYFIAALLGRQMLPGLLDRNGREDPDLYFPLFTVLQFVFYVGWLKVAEVLINPFGEDDDDIELNWLIDRHIKAAYMIVDEMHEEHPELLRDQYWECVVPKDLPYTVASEHYRKDEPKGSAEKYKVKQADAMYANILPSGGKRVIADDVYADYESVDTPMVERRKNNWLVRQLSRMDSIRSQSTAYSSGGIAFNRNRLNSVYSSPESGLPLSMMQQQHQQAQQHMAQAVPNQLHPPLSVQSKPSLYEKFVHRKSIRAQKQLIKHNSKLNGLNPNAPKSRPRIPTPDVTKDNAENGKEPNGKSNLSTALTSAALVTSASAAPIATNTVIMAPQLSTQTAMYPYTSTQGASHDGQVLGTLLLSPIKEMDSSSSNNTLIPGHPATAALAKSVLPATIKDVGFGVPASIPVTTNITTLSFPFTVTTTSSDTDQSSTLNIVPISPAQLPTISTTAPGFDVSEVLTTIPVSLAIQRTPSSLSAADLLPNVGTDSLEGHDSKTSNSSNNSTSIATAVLSVKPLNGSIGSTVPGALVVSGTAAVSGDSSQISRTNSLKTVPNVTSSKRQQRKSSIGSSGQPEDSKEVAVNGTRNVQSSALTNPKIGPGATGVNGTAKSTPSPLSKHGPDSKTGEVYV